MTNEITEPSQISQPVDNKVFTSQGECSGITGVSAEILRFAKKNGAPGFHGSKIKWNELKPWLIEHQELIDNKKVESMEVLKKEDKRMDIRLKKLKEKELLGLYLDPKDVKDLLIRIGISQASVMKKWPAEMAAKVVGKSLGEVELELNNGIIEFMNLFKNEREKFIK